MNDMADKIQELYKEMALPLIGVLAAAATILGFWMGSQFILAGGDPEKLKKAKAQVKYFIIGWIVLFAVAALTPLFVAALQTWAQN